VRLGIAAFIVPFAFVLSPGLLLQGSPLDVAWAIGTALIGAVLLACAIRGYSLRPLNAVARLLIGAAGILFIGPGYYPPLVGIALAAAAVAIPPGKLRPRPTVP
jgi:TRAP-type uncharacterized transport system fused permease subunit